jgi:xanthine dehydrogenase YagR molybdenum-binding subunit
MPAPYIGQPLSRIDGHKKVTGRATYAAEFEVPDLAYAAAVRSTIACGRIAAIDSTAAERAPGVLQVLTHRNAARLPYNPQRGFIDPPSGERLHMLQDERVVYHGQPVALVVAETLEQAWHAATLVKVDYAEDTGSTDVGTAGRVAPRAFDADPATKPRAATSMPASRRPRCRSTPTTRSRARTTTRSSRTRPSRPGTATN